MFLLKLREMSILTNFAGFPWLPFAALLLEQTSLSSLAFIMMQLKLTQANLAQPEEYHQLTIRTIQQSHWI